MIDRRLRILLIEDDPDDAARLEELLCETLEEPTIEIIADREEAVRSLRDSQVDLVVLDQYIGAHCTLQLVAKLRQEQNSVPVLLLAGRGDPEIEAVAMRVGVTDCLPKSRIDAQCLERAVMRGLARSHTRDRPPALEPDVRPTALLDGEGRIRTVNEQLLKFLDCDEQSVVGTPLEAIDALKPAGNVSIRELVEAARAGKTRRIMIPMKEGGVPRLYEGRLGPLYDTRSEVRRIVFELCEADACLEQDISPLSNPWMLAMLIRNVPAAVAIFDDEFRYLGASRRWMQDFGLEGQTIIGRRIDDVYPVIRDHQDWIEALHRTLGGEICAREQENYTDDEGNEQWLRWELRPWHKEDGRIGGVIAFIEMITTEVRIRTQLSELRLTQQALARERSLLRAMIDSMTELVFHQDLEGRYLGCNQRYRDFFDIEDEQLIGRTDDELEGLGVTLPGVNRELTRRAIRSGKPERIVDEVERGGKRYHLETIVTPISDNEGVSNGVLGITRDETEWHRLLARLREQEERLDLALRASNIAVFTYHYDADHLDWDDRHFGLPENGEPHRLSDLLDVIFDKDRDQLRAAFENARETGSLEIEYRLPRPKGRIRRYVTQGRVLKGTDRLIGTTLDVTERTRAASDVQRAKERLDVALAATALGIMEWVPTADGRGRYRWDERVYQILGLPRDAKPSLRTFARLVHPDDFHSFRTDFADALRNPGPYRLTGRIRQPGGEPRVVELLGRIETENGQLMRQIGTIADITQRRRFELERERDRERLELAIKAAGLGTWMWQFEPMMIKIGPQQRELLGLPRATEELSLRQFAQLLNPDDRNRVFQEFDDSRKQLENLATTFRIRRPDNGKERVLECIGRIVTDESASPRLLVGITRDVTDLTLYQQELERARDAAEEATRAKSQFLANMSHEIRTPINAILGFSQLLKRSPGLTEEQRDHVETVLRSGDHLLKLVNDVLELSKIEAGMVSLNSKDFELKPLLNDLVRMFSLRVRDSDVDLRLEATGIDRLLHGDEGKIRQILINLLNNAVKFTPDGEIVLRASARTIDANDVELVLSVEDTGIGIGSEELPKIFGEFSQAGNAGLASEGTGLGLAICKTFAEMMDGRIEVESELGEGSRFTVHLRLAKAVGMGLERDDGPMVTALHPRHGHPKILIVDDKADHRKLLVELFSGVGFETQEASGIREAWSGVTQWEPDLVVLDVHMPQLNGYQLMSRIRSYRTRHVPILAMSASVNKETETTAYRAGADAYLRKPFGESDLFETMAEIGGWEFIRAGDEGDHEPGEPPDVVTRETLRLPDDIAGQIAKAAVSADMDTLMKLVDQIRPDHRTAARYLERLASQMEYDTILQLVKRAETLTDDAPTNAENR